MTIQTQTKQLNMVQQNTENVINSFRGISNEFYLLKGLLIAGHNMSPHGTVRFKQCIDTLMIAERMDELNKI